MDIHQLEVFIAAARYMNFTEAAQRLFMVQSAVSHSITTLEKELGLKLFTRRNNQISLTPAGEVFLKDAYQITAIARTSLAKMQGVRNGEIGHLRVGFVLPQMVDCFVPNFRSFAEKYPNVETCYTAYDCITLARYLEDGRVDVAFGREDAFIKNEGFRWKSLYIDDFVVVMEKNHPLAGRQRVRPAELAREKIFTMSREANPGMFDLINFIFMSNGITPNLNDDCNDHFTTIMLVRMGMGVAIFPTLYLRYLTENMTYATIDDPNAFHEIGIAWRTDNRNAAMSLFLREFGISEGA